MQFYIDNNCSVDPGDNCSVPFKLHSDAKGMIELSNINVTHDPAANNTNFDISIVSIANNGSDLFALIEVNGIIDYSNSNKYYRLFISKNDSSGNETTPERTNLAVKYDYRVEINGSECYVYNFTDENNNISGCSVSNNSNTMEIAVKLSDLNISANDNINITFETARSYSSYDFAPDYRSFLSYTITLGDVAPTVTLINPSANYVYGAGGPKSILFNCSATDIGTNASLVNISLYITNSSNQSFSLNSTTNISGTTNSSNWTLLLGNGNYTWNCEAYDVGSNSSFASANRTIRIDNSGLDGKCYNDEYTGGNWNVTYNIICANETIPVDGNITIKAGGNLTLYNVTINFTTTSDGSNFINKTPNGGLWIYDNDNNASTTDDQSWITANNTNYEYDFWVWGNGGNDNFTLKYSKIDECGYDDGDYIKQDDESWGLYLYNVSDIVIEGNSISDGGWYGPYIVSSANNNITNNTVYNLVHGIGLEFCNDFYIENNTLYDTQGGTGISLTSSDNNTIINSEIYAKYQGIRLEDSSNNTLTDNEVYNNTQYGILIYNGSNNNIIIDNTLYDNNTHGIGVNTNSNNNNITNNIVYNNSDDGIQLSSSSNNNTITSNTVYNNSKNGIEFSSSSNNNTITSNTVYNNSDDGISIQNSNNNTFINNTISGVIDISGDGVIFLSGSDNNEFINNTLSKSASAGFYIYSNSDNNIIKNNTINSSGSGHDNIYIFGLSGNTADDNTIEDNNITFSGRHGIFIYQYSEDNTIKDNTITNNTNHGILIGATSTDNQLIIRGLIANNSVGVNVTGAVEINITNTSFETNTNWDLFIDENSSVTALNCSFNKTKVNVSNGDIADLSNFTVKWYEKAYVFNGGAITGATVAAVNLNRSGFDDFNDTTDAGYTSIHAMADYLQNTTEFFYYIYNFTAEKDAYIDTTNTTGITDLRIINIQMNAAPVMNSSRIYSETNTTSSDLQGYCNATHADLYNLTYYYRWYKDDVENLSGVTSNNYTQGLEISIHNMTSGNLTVGDSWILSCLANSGEGNSSWLNSSVFEVEPFKFKITTTASPQTFSFQTDDAVGLYVDWGDGDNDTYDGTGLRSHEYATAGDYNISLTGGASRISFYEGTEDLLKDILTPMSNSVTGITSAENMFYSASGITTFTASNWFDGVSGNVTNMSSMFRSATSFNQDIGNWNVSSVIDMQYMFYSATSFNQDIGNWNVSSVTNMYIMFYQADAFNQNLSNWDVSNVVNMQSMFSNTDSFNGSLSNWDVSSVTTMKYMFYHATSFNQDIGNWNVSNVTTMYRMFYYATSFNQNLSNWDVSSVETMYYMFYNADSFNGSLSNWDVSSVTNMYGMFYYATSFNQDIGNWNVSNVTTMERMFYNANAFNQNLSNWNPSNVTTMERMFYSADSFNGSLSNWDVSSVETMYYMFYNANAFNQNLSNWNVSSVETMYYMFYNANAFNQNLSNWNVSSVINMNSTFSSADSFNGNISNWDVSSVTTMGRMFYNANAFNQNLSNWNVSSVTNMDSMFQSADSFNGSLSNWDVSSVTTMRSMFYDATSFNGNISNWNPSSVTTMDGGMFQSATSFNQNLSNWNVSSVTTMERMFQSATSFNGSLSNWNPSNVIKMNDMFKFAGAFNQDISGWDVSKVNDMDEMFEDANAFDQNLSAWNVSTVADMYQMFNGIALSISNYDSLLIGWAGLTPNLQSSVPFHGGNSKYSLDAVSARNDTLIGVHSWTITDGGLSANDAPNDPTVSLVSVDGTNSSSADLNCSATIIDPDSGDKLNVTIKWYKDSVLNLTIDYNNSYNNGTLFNATLDSGNLSGDDIWKCGMRLYDGSNYSNWVNSSNLTILNNSAPTVSLSSPADSSSTTDRTPLFDWTSSDSDGDDLTYEINITPYYGGNPSALDVRHEVGFNDSNYTPSSDLQLLYDNGYYYKWKVRADDGTVNGSWSEEWIINISSTVGLLLNVDEINFGNMSIGDLNNTDNAGVNPFRLENNGTVLINISVNASSIWTSETSNSTYYQFKVDNDSVSGETGTFNESTSKTSWFNTPFTAYVIAIDQLNYSDAKDTVEVDINLEVPPSEDPGTKSSTITFKAELAE